MMNRSVQYITMFTFALHIVVVATVYAGWLEADIPVCIDPRVQHSPVVVSAVDGSTFIAWMDERDGNVIFVQKFDSSGSAVWTDNGINVSEQAGRHPSIIPDCNSGAFIVFEADSTFSTYWHEPGDYRLVTRITVVRIDKTGSLLWKKQLNPYVLTHWSDLVNETRGRIFSDGEDGIIVIWEAASGYDVSPTTFPQPGKWGPNYIYAQRLDATGQRLWGLEPIRICEHSSPQSRSRSIQSDPGAVITAWSDSRYESTGNDIFAQKIHFDGSLLWGAQGVPVVIYSEDQDYSNLVSDGVGGAVVTWFDFRGDRHIFSQRLDNHGSMMWDADGNPICSIDGEKENLGIISSAQGSWIISWAALYQSHMNIFAQRINSSGMPQWTSNGKRFSNGIQESCSRVKAIPDGAGGAVICWELVEDCYMGRCELRDMWGTSETNIFAVGDGGRLLHYEG